MAISAVGIASAGVAQDAWNRRSIPVSAPIDYVSRLSISSDGWVALVAWEEYLQLEPDRNTRRIFVSATDRDGPARFERSPIDSVSTGSQTEPIVIHDGTWFLVAWIDTAHDDRRLMARYVDPDDGPEGSSFTVAQLAPFDPNDPDTDGPLHLDAAFDGLATRLFWVDPSPEKTDRTIGISTAWIFPSGFVAGPQQITSGWDFVSGLDAVANAPGVLLCAIVRSTSDERILVWKDPTVGTYPEQIFTPNARYDPYLDPRISPDDVGWTVAWLVKGASRMSIYNPLELSSRTRSLSKEAPEQLRILVSGHALELLRVDGTPHLFWLFDGMVYVAGLSPDLAIGEPAPILPGRSFRAVHHAPGAVMARVAKVADGSEVIMVDFLRPTRPRHRGARNP